jgi:3-oxoacyl-[acyl-carrier protein] reductase
MNTGLKDRVVIVAAASQGIGRATAEAFAAEGAKVAICSRQQKSIEAAAELIRSKLKAEVFPRALDVTDADAVRQFVTAVAEKYGRVDVCVTNAGGPPTRTFLTATNEDWQNAFNLNFMSTVHFAREVVPHMQRQKWGRIITLTSLSVKQPIADLILSNAIRTAVVGLVKSMANELGRDGITVNNVGPGYTATDRLKELADVRAQSAGTDRDAMFAEWAKATAAGRIAQPGEVANAIVWLASEGAAMVTGQTILVDGGSYKGTF